MGWGVCGGPVIGKQALALAWFWLTAVYSRTGVYSDLNNPFTSNTSCVPTLEATWACWSWSPGRGQFSLRVGQFRGVRWLQSKRMWLWEQRTLTHT